jgi:hypothetical protein
MKLFYTGPAINAEMLVTMLEKHGICAEQRTSKGADPEDLGAEAEVLVPEEEFERARQLFYSEREDEL